MEEVEAILFDKFLHVLADELFSLLSSLKCLVLALLACLPNHFAQRDVEQLE